MERQGKDDCTIKQVIIFNLNFLSISCKQVDERMVRAKALVSNDRE